MKFVKDLFTDNSGDDADIVSVMAALLIVAFIIISAVDVIVNQNPFAMQDFGIAGGALLAGLGGAYRWKAGTQEPK